MLFHLKMHYCSLIVRKLLLFFFPVLVFKISQSPFSMLVLEVKNVLYTYINIMYKVGQTCHFSRIILHCEAFGLILLFIVLLLCKYDVVVTPLFGQDRSQK